MGEGRGSAMVCVVMVCVLLMLQYSQMAHAAVYTVGGAQGWTFNVASWPKGKRFRAGDTLGKVTISKTFKNEEMFFLLKSKLNWDEI